MADLEAQTTEYWERRDELVERQQRELAELQAQQEKERRELVERQQQERAEQSGALSEVTQLSQLVVDLEGTGAAVAIAAAVKSFRNIAPAPHGKVEVEGGVNRPPMERSPAGAALFQRARALAEQLGGKNRWKLAESATGGGSDGNFTAALGIPTLDGMGAVGEGAHASHEAAVIAEIPRRTALLAALIAAVVLSRKELTEK